ncbi:nucleotidyl transferase AbiEii/AbiGii toxin family protein [Streptomyces sp. NPDC049577]|uniref:nucleotidyl transferase AbiEii/AbiGii toxin family protein n=1 Tax=Streptomyces sp. NPDC049577 TaxID=3155153 RepID=UPI00342F9708
MRLPDLHRRLLTDLMDVGSPYPLVLTGGYAVQAHGLVDRLSSDLDLATEAPARMDAIVSSVRDGLQARGWLVSDIEIEALSARLLVTDAVSGEECEVDILKETMWRPPLQSEYGPVLAVEDVVGTKMRALANRGLPRDLIDVHGASERWSRTELEEFGRRHAWDEFDLTDLQVRLSNAEWLDDSEFAAYGLDEAAITDLRRWAQEWADDIGERLAEEAPYEEPDQDE